VKTPSSVATRLIRWQLEINSERRQMHYQEGVAREQAILFPETLGDYITDDNPVQFIDAFVDSLDLGLSRGT
jgi:hypothetical protein